MTISDLDQINADLMGGNARNAFGRNVQPGDELTGEIIAAVRRQRRNSEGQPLFWVNRKPTPAVDGQPVIDSILIVDTGIRADEEDEGMRSLYMDRDVQRALFAAIRQSGAEGIKIGARIEGFVYVGPAEVGVGRVYSGGTYLPPTV
ncbi:hypothetical protein [Nocardia sp. NBC_00403]|uniref:hypothetical protein n=1 Tax=Nocardia sp. NBC_00403 TaxID=2975990 RepID=UPI002E1F7867